MKKVFFAPINRYLAFAVLIAFILLTLLYILKNEFLIPPQVEINDEAAVQEKAP